MTMNFTYHIFKYYFQVLLMKAEFNIISSLTLIGNVVLTFRCTE